MEVILLEKIRKLGDLGEKVKVAAGFGRNYLLPQKKAIPATDANLAEFEKRRSEYEAKVADQLSAAKVREEKLVDFTVTIEAHMSDEGRLFGSIGTKEIAEVVTQAGFELQKSEVRLPSGPIRDSGEHEIIVQLHSDVSANIKINVVASK